ncbi:MAG: NAD-binding protein [Magnetococcales bacterium]|nr:NAD-binding protein [Magnetococcales bacterium]
MNNTVSKGYHFWRRIKQRTRQLLENPDGKGRGWVGLFSSMLVVAALVVVIRDTDPHLSPFNKTVLDLLETVLTGIFLLEYALRWWVASDLTHDFRYSYHRHRRRHDLGHWATLWRALFYALLQKGRWMRQPMAIIDLIACLPFFPVFRNIALLRVLCILKLFRYSRQLSMVKTVLKGHAREFTAVLMIAAILWSLVAIAFYVVERGDNPRIQSLWDAYYWMVITVATLGYGDIVPHTTMGQAVAMVGVVVGITISTFMSLILITALTELLLYLRENRMEHQIALLSDYYIVCGLSDVGRAVCSNLSAEKKWFVGVDQRADRVEAAIREGWLATQGTLQDELIWKRLNLAKAKGVIIAVNDEATNISVVLIVRDLAPHCTIVACSATPSAEKRLLKLGATRVVSPTQIGGLQLTHSALRPTALHFLDLVMKTDYSELEMEELLLPHHSQYENMSLMDSRIHSEYDVIVVGILPHHDPMSTLPQHDKMIFNPRADTILRPGDTLVCLGHEDDMQRLRETIGSRRA